MEIFNKACVKDVSGLSGNRVRPSNKAVNDVSVLQVGTLNSSLGCHLPLEAVVSLLHRYFGDEFPLNNQPGTFAGVSYLQNQVSQVSSEQTRQTSPNNPFILGLAQSSVGALSPPCPLCREMICCGKGKGTPWGSSV